MESQARGQHHLRRAVLLFFSLGTNGNYYIAIKTASSIPNAHIEYYFVLIQIVKDFMHALNLGNR
jgi:hypothetical protein